jgi:superfamily II DNA/RNA helicase
MADDLEGNWEPSGGPIAAEPIEVAAELRRGHQKKKRKLNVAEVDSPVVKKKKKKLQHTAISGKTGKGSEVEAAVSSSKKKRKKKASKRQSKEGVLPRPDAPAEELGPWALSRFSSAWQEEIKAKSLSPLEAKEMRPLCDWFLPLAPSQKLEAVLRRFDKAETKQVPKNVGILVLCSSAERAFGIISELKAASLKPIVLAAHGGGRKSDQVKRQAAAISKGARLAVATPGRFLRLLDEGHVAVDGLRYVAVDIAQDLKHRDLFTLAETRSDVISLTRRYLLTSLEAGRLRIALFGAS